MNDTEIEVKFYVNDLQRVEARLLQLGAALVEPRGHEANIRFDRPDGSLRAGMCALRLRRDHQARLTYKGPPQDRNGTRVRTEIEFTVGDFDAAKKFIEALGYIQVAFYEKYRTTYALGSNHIMLDELPYGNFVEIEGADSESIRAAASRLGLTWDASVPLSYLAIFEQFCAQHKLDPSQLTFAALQNLQITPTLLHVRPADV